MTIRGSSVEVFVDASFWVSYSYPRDENNTVTVNQWELVQQERWNLITTNWTLYEALTIINGRRIRRHDLALGLMNVVASRAQIVDAAEFEQRAVEVFRSHSDKRWSIVDCANFVCIGERQAPYALSFDRDFAQAQAEFGFGVLGAGAS